MSKDYKYPGLRLNQSFSCFMKKGKGRYHSRCWFTFAQMPMASEGAITCRAIKAIGPRKV